MPINYKDYHPRWKKISEFIRFYRAGNRCEWCKVENYAVGYWIEGCFITEDRVREYLDRTGIDLTERIGPDAKPIKIILTVAHLDRNVKNNSFFNLAALCQRCHLNYDRSQHVRNRRYGRRHDRLQGVIDFPEPERHLP